MTEPPVVPPATPHGSPGTDEPRWGLGEVALGIAAAQVLAVLVAAPVYLAAGWSAERPPPMWGVALLQVPLWTALCGVVVWAAWYRGNGLRSDFGAWMRWFDVPIGIVVGVAVQLLVLPLMYLPLFGLLDVDADDLAEPARDLASRADGPVGWLLFALVVVVGAPVAEELFYRGLLLGSLRKRGLPAAAAVVLSAALFGLMHFQVLQFAGLFVFGLVLALLVVVTGRLGPALWAHVAFNATTVVALWAER